MSVVPKRSTSSSRAASASAAATAATAVLTEKQLERVGKILPLIIVILTIVILPVATWYATSKSRDAYIDTLIVERGTRSMETREKLEGLEKSVDSEKVANAEFRGETRASLRAIEKALDVERSSSSIHR